jgi:hypothetical protein
VGESGPASLGIRNRRSFTGEDRRSAQAISLNRTEPAFTMGSRVRIEPYKNPSGGWGASRAVSEILWRPSNAT